MVRLFSLAAILVARFFVGVAAGGVVDAVDVSVSTAKVMVAVVVIVDGDWPMVSRRGVPASRRFDLGGASK